MDPLVIVNPASGRGKTLQALPRFKDLLAEAHFAAEIRVSRGHADVTDWADHAAECGRTVVAFGGDGLVHAVLNATAGRVPVGVVPSGVGNDFARAVGIPLDLAATVRALETGHTQTIDLGRVQAGDKAVLFGCIASAGFDSEANEWANRITWLSGRPLYTYAALATLIGWHSGRFTIETETNTEEVPAWLVAVGNGRSYGAGMQICPSADLGDGLLDVTILEDMGKLEFLATFPKVFAGTHVKHPRVRTFRTERIELRADRPFRCYADGEDFANLPVTIEAVPAAARVIVPPPAA